MNLLKNPVFIICCVLFVAHQILQKGLEISLPLIDRYLDSLLAMPIILTLLLWERRYIFKRGKGYHLSLVEIVMATAFIALISEIIFPALSEDFTFDWFDILFYMIGSTIYFLLIQKRSFTSKEN